MSEWDLHIDECNFSINLHRARRLSHKQRSVDNVSDTSITDESMSEITTTTVPRVRSSPSSDISILSFSKLPFL